MTTVRAAVAHALRNAANFNKDAFTAPAAVLWPDPERTWEPVIRLLQEAVPILVLGEHEPESAQGPAIWIRAVLSDAVAVELPDYLARHDDKNPWVIYLPGVARADLADPATMPPALQPLADVELRSVWWPGTPSQAPWTPHSFLASIHGAALDLAGDAATRDALISVLELMLHEDVGDLRAKGRLDAARLHALAIPDQIRTLLQWVNDPERTRSSLDPATWKAFAATARDTYGVDPARDTVITAAGRLGTRQGKWATVWERFADNPGRYAHIPAALDKARPQGGLFDDDDPHPDSWPSWNADQEADLRKDLTRFASVQDVKVAQVQLTELAARHMGRGDSVWAALGQAPLARAMPLLAELVDSTGLGATVGTDVAAITAWYVGNGHRVDRLALEALGSVRTDADRAAIVTALGSVYDPWLDDLARSFQKAAGTHYPGQTGLEVAHGTCVMFVDALRADLGHRLSDRLAPLVTTLESRVAAFPTVTPTGQPAVAPVDGGWGSGPGFDAGDAQERSVKGDVIRKALADAGVQYLDWRRAETGDPTGIGWTQTSEIDALGHAHGHALALMLDQQLELIAERVRLLVARGWQRVVVVTDHGFLLPATPAPKVMLPLHLTEGEASRKPRVARLKSGAQRPAFPTVPWTWDADVDMVSAPGRSAFEANCLYEHGGLSPQECAIPVITVTPSDAVSPLEEAFAAQIAAVRWTGQRCRIDFTPTGATLTAEIRLAAGDASSIVGGPKTPSDAGEFKLLVDEEQAGTGTTAYVVLLSASGAVVAQQQTTVGKNP